MRTRTILAVAGVAVAAKAIAHHHGHHEEHAHGHGPCGAHRGRTDLEHPQWRGLTEAEAAERLAEIHGDDDAAAGEALAYLREQGYLEGTVVG